MSPRALLRRDVLIGGAVLLAPSRPHGAEPPRGLAVLLHALAAAMRRAAGALQARHRRDATEALDRSRRLARFADRLPGLPPAVSAAFAGAHGAVEQGRHALQNGRPEQAATILAEEARRLEAAPLAEAMAIPGAGHLVRGATVLDPRGEVIGEVAEIRDAGGTVEVSLGGLLGIGAERLQVPASRLLAGREEAMLLDQPGAAERSTGGQAF